MNLRMIQPFAAAAVLLACAARLHAADGKFFNSNGVKIHYVEEGEGEPVVLIHGFAGDLASNWVATDKSSRFGGFLAPDVDLGMA